MSPLYDLSRCLLLDVKYKDSNVAKSTEGATAQTKNAIIKLNPKTIICKSVISSKDCTVTLFCYEYEWTVSC